MKDFLLRVRSTLLWAAGFTHFFFGGMSLVVLSLIFRPERFPDWTLHTFCRNVVRLTGARLVVRRAGHAPGRPCLFAANHVNVFDPFVVCCAVRGKTRGLELESHFKVPIYGTFMRAMGNVAVPDRINRQGLERLSAGTKRALDRGISVVVFPEGTRTRTGRTGRFRPGMFRMAVEFGVPIVPVTLIGAYALKRVGSSLLSPGVLEVLIHDPVEPGDDPEALREKVRAIVVGPLGEGMPEAASSARGPDDESDSAEPSDL